MLTDEERATLEPERQEWHADFYDRKVWWISRVEYEGLLRDLARARMEIARLKAERLDALEDMLRLQCMYGTATINSAGNLCGTAAMRELAALGRLVIDHDHGRFCIGHWADPGKRAEGAK